MWAPADSDPAHRTHSPAYHLPPPRPPHPAVPPIAPTSPPTTPAAPPISPIKPPVPPPHNSYWLEFRPPRLRIPPKPRLLLTKLRAYALASYWLASRLIPPMTPSLPGSGHLEGGSLCAGGREGELRCRWRCQRLFRVSAPLPRGGGGNLEPWLSGSCVAWQGLEADLRDAYPRTPCCGCRVS